MLVIDWNISKSIDDIHINKSINWTVRKTDDKNSAF